MKKAYILTDGGEHWVSGNLGVFSTMSRAKEAGLRLPHLGNWYQGRSQVWFLDKEDRSAYYEIQEWTVNATL